MTSRIAALQLSMRRGNEEAVRSPLLSDEQGRIDFVFATTSI
jgi:hypothetical protein